MVEKLMNLKSSDALLLALQEAGATSYAGAVDEETVFRIAKTHTDTFHSRHFNGGKFLMERRLLWKKVAAKEVACIRRKQKSGEGKEGGHLFYLKKRVSTEELKRKDMVHKTPIIPDRLVHNEKFWVGTKTIPFILFRVGALSPESALEKAGLTFRARYISSFYDPAFHEGEILDACLDYCIAVHHIFYTQSCGLIRYYLSEDGVHFVESIDCHLFESKLAQFEMSCVVLPTHVGEKEKEQDKTETNFLNGTCTVKDIFSPEILPITTDQSKICLVVDSRENKKIINDLKAQFALHKLPIRIAPLPSGDYAWAQVSPNGEEINRLRCVIERKTLEDFGATVAQNKGKRHAKQVEKLKAQEGRVCYLIEGDEEDGTAHFYGISKGTMEEHMRVLVNNHGFLVIRTKDQETTVKLLLNLTRELNSSTPGLKT